MIFFNGDYFVRYFSILHGNRCKYEKTTYIEWRKDFRWDTGKKQCAGTESTDVFYTGESDGADENIDLFTNVTVEDSFSTLPAEIAHLDTIGFDEPLVLDESVDM